MSVWRLSEILVGYLIWGVARYLGALTYIRGAVGCGHVISQLVIVTIILFRVQTFANCNTFDSDGLYICICKLCWFTNQYFNICVTFQILLMVTFYKLNQFHLLHLYFHNLKQLSLLFLNMQLHAQKNDNLPRIMYLRINEIYVVFYLIFHIFGNEFSCIYKRIVIFIYVYFVVVLIYMY